MWHCAKSISIAFTICVALVRCNAFVIVQNSKVKREVAALSTTPSGSSNPGSASAITLTASTELVSVTTDLTSALSSPSSGPFATTNNIFALVAPPAVTGPVANTNSPQAPAAAPTLQTSTTSNSSTPTIVTPYTSYNLAISSVATFSSEVESANKVCDLVSPYSAIVCAIGSITIPSTSLTSAAITAKAYVKGYSSNYVSSNALTTKAYLFKQLTNFSTDDNLLAMSGFGNYVYFMGKNSGGFYKVFRTNGTTVDQISDTQPGSDDVNTSRGFIELNGYLYFGADYPGGEILKLTRTNGTTLERLTNNNPGSSDQYQIKDSGRAVICNNTLISWLADSASGIKYGSFDGTTLRKLSDLQGLGSSDISNITNMYNGCLNNRMYLGGYAGLGYNRLFSTDGTDFKQISNTSGGVDDYLKAFYVKVNSKILFQASTTGAAAGTKLHITDGTSVNAESNTCAGCNDGSWPAGLQNYKFSFGEILFIGLNTSAGVMKLFSHDGTTLRQLTDTCSGCSDAPSVFSSYSSHGETVDSAYFSATVTGGFTKLFKTDGSSVTQISNTNPGGNDTPTWVGNLGKYLFVTLKNSAGFTKLYSYDGATLQQLADFSGAANDTIGRFNSSNFYLLKSEMIPNFDGRFYFMAKDSAGSNHLYSSNGTDLMQMTNFNTANGGEFIANGACAFNAMMVVYNSKAYFSGVRTDATACNDHLFVLQPN